MVKKDPLKSMGLFRAEQGTYLRHPTPISTQPLWGSSSIGRLDHGSSCASEAIEKLDWYAMRWKIEVFHKILKSGCKAKESKLRTADRLANLISVFCILSWRVFWLTMLNRTAPDAPPEMALTEGEIRVLDHLVPDTAMIRRDAKHYRTI